jgi:signal recognition particle subunit SRP54
MAKMSMLERIRMVSGLGKMGGFMPGAKLAVKDQGDGGLSPRERAALRRKKKHR